MLSTYFEQSSIVITALLLLNWLKFYFRRLSFSDIENPLWGHALNFIFIFINFAFSEILLQIFTSSSATIIIFYFAYV